MCQDSACPSMGSPNVIFFYFGLPSHHLVKTSCEVVDVVSSKNKKSVVLWRLGKCFLSMPWEKVWFCSLAFIGYYYWWVWNNTYLPVFIWSERESPTRRTLKLVMVDSQKKWMHRKKFILGGQYPMFTDMSFHDVIVCIVWRCDVNATPRSLIPND